MRSRAVSLWRNERGAVAATYAVALMGLIVVAGVGYDYSRMVSIDSELQNAADQAALAGATQLDRAPGACARASAAAVQLLRNLTMLANDGGGNQVTVTGVTNTTLADACGASGQVRFYKDSNKSAVAYTDAEARFIEVWVNPREAFYALTPVLATFSGSGDLNAAALAGVGSAVCRVPPLMICSPSENPALPWDPAAHIGIGIAATGGGAWTPGGFGFLEVGTNQLNDLAKTIAFGSTNFDCVKADEGSDPETGNAQVLFEAVNTRFDISPTGGGVLAPCDSGSCPPAANVVKDVIKINSNTNGNACRLTPTNNNGWTLPAVANRFTPRPWTSTDSRSTTYNQSGTPEVMGYGRDMCHYTSYAKECRELNGIAFGASVGNAEKNRFGNGMWAIQDYFAKNHGIAPPNANMTRYEAYRWEIDNSSIPGISSNQRPTNLCVSGTSDIDRRVLTIALVTNCDQLRGGSTEVDIQDWVDVFLVEPVVDENSERNRGRTQNSIYVEIIRKANLGGDNGAVSQTIRRDIPYLIE